MTRPTGPDRRPLLARPELRSVRLEIEYLAAELGLRDHGIEHTIVVFGSTRVGEQNPYYAIARELGPIVGRCGEGIAAA